LGLRLPLRRLRLRLLRERLRSEHNRNDGTQHRDELFHDPS
jgi:hypothetical protein